MSSPNQFQSQFQGFGKCGCFCLSILRRYSGFFTLCSALFIAIVISLAKLLQILLGRSSDGAQPYSRAWSSFSVLAAQGIARSFRFLCHSLTFQG